MSQQVQIDYKHIACQCNTVCNMAEQRLKEGREVGALARGIFGEYVETISYTTDGRLDLDSLLKNTQKYLAQGKENICEAAFVYQHCYCAVDILHRTEQGYDIYEVKASTSLEEEYIVECAYQKWVVENAGIHVGKVFVVYINNQYVRNGEVDLHQLLKIQEVTEKRPETTPSGNKTTTETNNIFPKKRNHKWILVRNVLNLIFAPIGIIVLKVFQNLISLIYIVCKKEKQSIFMKKEL